MEMTYDFSGWATRNDLQCSDGRIIRKDAFKHNDGAKVPLVWNHQHNAIDNVIGHAILENRDEGVYAYGYFNDSEQGKLAKLLIQHGDVNALSIYANGLKQNMNNVTHGNIRELSLVLAGANPGAYIESVIRHGEESDEEAIVYTGEDIILKHAEEKKEEKPVAETKERTIGDVYDEMTDEQKKVVHYMVGQALEGKGAADDDDDDYEEDEEMKHNVFDQDTQTQENTLCHADVMAAIGDAKRYGSMKEAFLAHNIESTAEFEGNYGIKGADDWLFPEARLLNNPPEFIKRDTGWVAKVMNGTHHTPFSRIKSMFADLREEDARALGYIKGKLKKEEVFSLLKRTTTPTTIYKKQKMDRDDVIDITGFDVIAWLKSEMRMMLDEEIARAILVGDGRLADSDDHINETHIRPVWTDHELFTVKSTYEVNEKDDADTRARAFIRKCIKDRKFYKGSGEPTLFTTEDMLTDCLLIEDSNGRVIYESVEKLKNTLRVKEIVTVPVMEGLTREVDGVTHYLDGLIVNLKDYNVGADKGGAINMFDDFDIDYNQQKYLIETRCSGALIKPYSAMAVEHTVGAAAEG